MRCPICGADTIVTGSRPSDETVARRRKCTNCGITLYTQEIEADYDFWRTVERAYVKKLRELANDLQKGKRHDKRNNS